MRPTRMATSPDASTTGTVDIPVGRAPTEPGTPPGLHGLDIETDTRVDGLDPTVASVLSVAVASEHGDVVFEPHDGPGGEGAMLRDLDDHLASIAPGVLVTWNGAGFDLPYLADRAAHHGVELGLRLVLDPGLSRREPLAGHLGAYRAVWHAHRHLDAYRVYRADVGPLLGISCRLKNVARLAGLRPVEVDRTAIHELGGEQLRAYVASDARLARELALRRWPGIAAHVDEVSDVGPRKEAPTVPRTVTGRP